MFRLLLLTTLPFFAGCDGPITPAKQLFGHWQGRPETADERTLREWPVRDKADLSVALPPTDMEDFPDLRIDLWFDRLGKATLSLDGKEELSGDWTLTPGEGRKQLLEITINRKEETVVERRRFEIEMLERKADEPDRFVLHESGADPRFGRLIFERNE